MSRGLGVEQRRILKALSGYKGFMELYELKRHAWGIHFPDGIGRMKRKCEPGEGVYNIRWGGNGILQWYHKDERGRLRSNKHQTFKRALNTLCKRGLVYRGSFTCPLIDKRIDEGYLLTDQGMDEVKRLCPEVNT